MVDPFASVAESYDLMIDWPARLTRERPFFSGLLPDMTGKRMLDVGSGTGHHSAMFAELGAEVIGLDPSSAMLARARELFPGGNPCFVEGAFADVAHLSGQFDLITVLGNTLAYAHNADDLSTILRTMYDKLVPNGRLCIQVVNYDSLLAEESRWLPLIHRHVGGTDYLFLREYRRVGERVEFTIIRLQHDDAWSQSAERSLHLAITADILRDGLQRAGFNTINCYGDFQRSPYHPDTSPGLIAVAVCG